jgi:hypothetical protein
MRILETTGLLRPSCALLVLALLAPGALAEPLAWDQKAATKIAVSLADTPRDLNHTVRRNPQ